MRRSVAGQTSQAGQVGSRSSIAQVMPRGARRQGSRSQKKAVPNELGNGAFKGVLVSPGPRLACGSAVRYSVPMKVLVTGGAGFVASHVVDACVEDGHEVLVVDDLSTGRLENLNQKVAFEQLDVASPALAEAVDRFRPAVINHHAAQVSVRNSVNDPAEDARRNVLGTINVLEAARRSDIRHVVFASSGGAIYGEPARLPADESVPIAPVSPYGVSKYVCELYGDYYRRTLGLTFTALRYANIYGPRQDPNGEAGVVAIFSGQMLAGTQPTINGDGTQVRDYTYVGDVVRANVLALKRRPDGAFNVGTSVPTSVNELFGLLRDLTGFSGEEYHGPAKAGDAQVVYLDATSAATHLGWSPQTSLRDGLADTVSFFRDAAP